jgi:hypothetical protein
MTRSSALGLILDLERFGQDFLSGDAGVIRRRANELEARPHGMARPEATEERVQRECDDVT